MVRRSRTKIEASQYLPYEFCFGFFFQDTLYQHNKKCMLRPKSALPGESAIVVGRCLISPFVAEQDGNELMNELLDGLKETAENAGMRK